MNTLPRLFSDYPVPPSSQASFSHASTGLWLQEYSHELMMLLFLGTFRSSVANNGSTVGRIRLTIESTFEEFFSDGCSSASIVTLTAHTLNALTRQPEVYHKAQQKIQHCQFEKVQQCCRQL